MILAELEVRHTRLVAPSRRVAIGRYDLPSRGNPSSGPVLLAAIAGVAGSVVDDDTRAAARQLAHDVAHHRRIPQPRLRYRYQTDTEGLETSTHRLSALGTRWHLDLDDNVYLHPTPQLVASCYALRHISFLERHRATRLFGQALEFSGNTAAILDWLLEGAHPTTSISSGSVSWARHVLGLEPDIDLSEDVVNDRFRQLVRVAHPDHGAATDQAGEVIGSLVAARRALLDAVG